MMSSRRCVTSFESVAAVAQQAGEVDVGEIGEGPALGRRHADLRRRGVVVELDEEALQQFPRGLACERAGGEARLVEGPEVLIEVARAEGVPAVELGDHGEVAEPVHLQRLVEVAGRVGRDPPADVGDLQQLPPAGVILRPRGLRLCQFRVALREAHHRVAGDRHRPQLFALVERLRVAFEIERGLGPRDVGVEVQHPLAIELAVGHGVSGRPLLHELREAAGRIGVEPVLRQFGEHLVAQGAAAPEGNDLALVFPDDRRVHLVLRLRAGVENAQVLGAVARELGIGRHRLRPGPALADDELAVAHPEGLGVADRVEVHRAQHRDAVPAHLFLVERRGDGRALAADRGDSVQAGAAQAFGACGHACPPMVVMRPRARNRAARVSSRPCSGGGVPRRA